MPLRLGQAIAIRHLDAGGRNPSRVTIRLGTPRRENSGVWLCPYQIRGLGRRPVDAAYGDDAFQALQLALEGIRVTLSKSRRKVSWVEPGDPGFPRYIPTFFGSAFAERLSRVVDHEVEVFAKAAIKRGKACLHRCET